MGIKEFKYENPCLYCKRGETLTSNIAEINISYEYSEYHNICSYNLRTKRGIEPRVRSSPNVPRKPSQNYKTIIYRD